MKKGEFNPIKLEKEICSVTHKEGLGSIYERIMLKRFFEDLARQYAFSTVLEYQGLAITKAIDNITFLKLGKEVTVADKEISQILGNWPFKEKPYFSLPQKKQSKFELVWNFAVVQLQPEIISEMISLSNKFVLIFVPNFLNWGMPVHQLYHFLTRTDCQHAERGSIFLRTQWGIKKLASQEKIKIIKIGYIDMPPLPDIGFSIKELKNQLGVKTELKRKPTSTNSEGVLKKINQMTFIEKLPLPEIMRLPFAHHLYLFGERK